VAGRIRSIEKSNDLIVNQSRDLPGCSIVPQPTMLLAGAGMVPQFGHDHFLPNPVQFIYLLKLHSLDTDSVTKIN
jgi:hypothetical protein